MACACTTLDNVQCDVKKFWDPARNILINTPQESPPEAFEELEDAAEEKKAFAPPILSETIPRASRSVWFQKAETQALRLRTWETQAFGRPMI